MPVCLCACVCVYACLSHALTVRPCAGDVRKQMTLRWRRRSRGPLIGDESRGQLPTHPPGEVITKRYFQSLRASEGGDGKPVSQPASQPGVHRTVRQQQYGKGVIRRNTSIAASAVGNTQDAHLQRRRKSSTHSQSAWCDKHQSNVMATICKTGHRKMWCKAVSQHTGKQELHHIHRSWLNSISLERKLHDANSSDI